jgi:CO dehydrogenase maturation factor
MMDNYPYLVVDNEAGMEHFSRLTTKYIDLLLIVSDSSRRGILSARRIYDLVDELGIRVGRKYLLVNQYRDKLERLVTKETETFGPDSVSTIPEDDLIYQFDLEGKPTVELPPDSVALQAANEVFEKLLIENSE